MGSKRNIVKKLLNQATKQGFLPPYREQGLIFIPRDHGKENGGVVAEEFHELEDAQKYMNRVYRRQEAKKILDGLQDEQIHVMRAYILLDQLSGDPLTPFSALHEFCDANMLIEEYVGEGDAEHGPDYREANAICDAFNLLFQECDRAPLSPEEEQFLKDAAPRFAAHHDGTKPFYTTALAHSERELTVYAAVLDEE